MKISDKRLSTILKVKNHQERVAQQELTFIRHRKDREKEVFNRLEETKQTAIGDLAKSVRIRANELQSNRAYISDLTEQMQDQIKKISDMQQEEDGKREELIEKSQSKRIMEKLEEKKNLETAQETNRKDQRLMDVLAHRIRWSI
jgi:flagellar export protein FliJ